MTSSIVLTNTIDIRFNKKNSFKYKDEDLNEVYEFKQQEIPAVRYRFNAYTLKEIVYIKNSLQKFRYSVHIAEVNLSECCVDYIEKLVELKEVAVFLYFDITKENVVTKTFNESQRKVLGTLKDTCLDKIERIMMRDVDGVLHMMVARPLILSLANLLGLDKSKIGYCSCAFSANGLCCLTAERARDIAARYSSNSNFAIATNAVEGKNIEHQNGCYCIRHILITHDTEQDSTDKLELKVDKVDKGDGGSKENLDGQKEVIVTEEKVGKKTVTKVNNSVKSSSKGKPLKIPKGACRF